MSYVSIAEHQDVVIASIDAEKLLDAGMIRQIGNEFSKLTLEAAGGRRLLLTFRRVSFMSSAMLGEIIRLSKQAKADRIDLKLCDISPTIMEVFKLMKLDKIIDIRKTMADGLAAFGPPRKGWKA